MADEYHEQESGGSRAASIVGRGLAIILRIIYFIAVIGIGAYLATAGGSSRKTSYPYKCTRCGTGFYKQSDLTVYNGNGTGKCLECLAEESRQRLLDDIQKNKTR